MVFRLCSLSINLEGQSIFFFFLSRSFKHSLLLVGILLVLDVGGFFFAFFHLCWQCLSVLYSILFSLNLLPRVTLYVVLL